MLNRTYYMVYVNRRWDGERWAPCCKSEFYSEGEAWDHARASSFPAVVVEVSIRVLEDPAIEGVFGYGEEE